MVYLVIKELSTIAEDVIMVTSSLMKDMQPTSEVMYRANAIRVLRKITDVRSSFCLIIHIDRHFRSTCIRSTLTQI